MFEKLNEFFQGETGENMIIHPDFRIKTEQGGVEWRWNYTDNLRFMSEQARRLSEQGRNYDGDSLRKMAKVAFAFDDPSLLDDCPWMCKLGKNMTSNPDTQYFGVAYCGESEADDLVGWARRFPRAELFTHLDDDALQTPNTVVTKIEKEGVGIGANDKELSV